MFHQLNYKTMKILVFVFFALISISVQSQLSEEKVAADGSRYIVYVPRQFSEEEIEGAVRMG